MTTKTKRSWYDMKRRCIDEKFHSYHRYGGRGIKVCDRWLMSYENFLIDMGEKPQGLTLDRENNDGNYEPSNCRWATRGEQTKNSSSYKGGNGCKTVIRITNCQIVTSEYIKKNLIPFDGLMALLKVKSRNIINYALRKGLKHYKCDDGKSAKYFSIDDVAHLIKKGASKNMKSREELKSRIRAGWKSNQDFSDLTGIKPTILSAILSSRFNPTGEECAVIAKHIGCTEDDVLTDFGGIGWLSMPR